MTSFSAKNQIEHSAERNVVFVVYPNIVLLDLVGPLQVFTHARRSAQHGSAYRTNVVSNHGGSIGTNTILPIESTSLASWLDNDVAIDTTIVVGGDGALPASNDQEFIDKFKQIARRSRRICSVCSGTFILAAAGLLDGRRAVTHWEDCHQLATLYPAINVEVDPIYVKDGNIWTSAGITAGIDMALAIIEEDLGKPAALEMARSLVTPIVRSGGQSQFSAELDRQTRDSEGQFAALHAWVKENIDQEISVTDMADECGMSPRNFSRRYSQIMGISPAKGVEAIRVDMARDALTHTRKAIKLVACECGFGDDERMRRAFLRHINTSPSDYRKQFQPH